MKLITSEMDAEAEKWQERDNEIIRRAKNMSSMAFSMYLFTRGEGPLHTTQDLFTQADYFTEEGTKLFHVVRQFSAQVTHWHLPLYDCIIIIIIRWQVLQEHGCSHNSVPARTFLCKSPGRQKINVLRSEISLSRP